MTDFSRGGGSPNSRDESPLWAITTYFNPVGYRRRLRNYQTFRERLDVPLVTVECSSTGKFDLRPDSADRMVQLTTPDILWQKERLLNIALEQLPDHCRYVAWLDCDVIFGDPYWPERACRLLDQYPLLHLFEQAFDVPADADLDQFLAKPASPEMMSLGAGIARNCVKIDDQLFARGRLSHQCVAGLAWAMPRDLIDRHHLYDACILGGGDNALICAAVGKFSVAGGRHKMTDESFEHYINWARPFFETIRGNIGYLDTRIFHLWHGDLRHRRNYANRFGGFGKYHFDPARDIALHESGCWRWNSEKREMHQFVIKYFETRREDG